MESKLKKSSNLEPLLFEKEKQLSSDASRTLAASANTTLCLFCKNTFITSVNLDEYLGHLLTHHKFVIADVETIPYFTKYIDHWRGRFKDNPKELFCAEIKTNSLETDTEPSEIYHLLCDKLPEDREIRQSLQKQKLEEVLLQQQREREDETFCRMCLFCRENYSNRSELFDHMNRDHSFSVGKSDNLVYTSELLDVLDNKLHSLLCLYCEKTFKDRHTLKEHMRKKQHKRLNPKNSSYDKYYIINYKELGKTWQTLRSDKDDKSDESDTDSSLHDELWSDWCEEDMGSPQVVCLFCVFSSPHHHALLNHMQACHKFDLDKVREENSLNFYQQVKLVNYIRRQVHQNTCPSCEEVFDDANLLNQHLSVSGHSAFAPDVLQWDQPQYYFPTYENDHLLCGLEEANELFGLGEGHSRSYEPEVIAEDIPVSDSMLSHRVVREELLKAD